PPTNGTLEVLGDPREESAVAELTPADAETPDPIATVTPSPVDDAPSELQSAVSDESGNDAAGDLPASEQPSGALSATEQPASETARDSNDEHPAPSKPPLDQRAATVDLDRLAEELGAG